MRGWLTSWLGTALALLLIAFAFLLDRQNADEAALAIAAGAVLAITLLPGRLSAFVVLAATGTLFLVQALRSNERAPWEQIVLPLVLLAALAVAAQLRRRVTGAADDRAPAATEKRDTEPPEVSLVLVRLHRLADRGTSEDRSTLAAEVAALAKAELRDTDTIDVTSSRALSIVLPGAGPLGARTVGERLRLLVGEARFDDSSLTASIGTATCPRDAPTLEALVETASRALNEAEARGGNRTLMASADLAPAGWVLQHQ